LALLVVEGLKRRRGGKGRKGGNEASLFSSQPQKPISPLADRGRSSSDTHKGPGLGERREKERRGLLVVEREEGKG